ncbi:MAG: thiolase domain-containing protein, partial [Verrucomicrobiota bacterium]|nr:thiolase domain-containing protein [Chthoniobacterales bacterium]MDQ3414604.1 thiolase domain-containing protein [Verrucomicrobiota bacterium]
LKKEGKSLRDVIKEAGRAALADAKIDAAEIQAAAVGNFNAGQFTKQLHLGAFIPEIDEKLHGIPTMHTEAACASGSLSVLLGSQWIMGGFHDAVLVVGAEQQKTMSSRDGSDVLGAAADFDVERPEYGDFMFPKLFGKIAQIYMDKYGATPDDLAAVAYKNYAHARLNPLAQMRDADLTFDHASQVSEKNPSVAEPLRVTDCSQITDGAAAVVLVSGKYLDRIGRDKSKLPRLLGFGHTTDYLALEKKDAPTFSTARKAAEKAFGMANLKPRDMHGAEVHDCFSITEIVAYEILGLAEPGKGAELAKSGATALPQARGEHTTGKFDFEIPVNTGGGLIGDGHPVGATGVRQVVDAYQQLTNQSGPRQIKDAKKFLTFNMGGSLTTSVAMIWGT